jgi:hypothetical protein
METFGTFIPHIQTVYRLADRGLIPPGVKVGGLRRWDLRQIEEFIEAGCKPVRRGVN